MDVLRIQKRTGESMRASERIGPRDNIVEPTARVSLIRLMYEVRGHIASLALGSTAVQTPVLLSNNATHSMCESQTRRDTQGVSTSDGGFIHRKFLHVARAMADANGTFVRKYFRIERM